MQQISPLSAETSTSVLQMHNLTTYEYLTPEQKCIWPLMMGTHIYIYIIYIIYTVISQCSPSGCGWREIPGVTQVEKGHTETQIVNACGVNIVAWAVKYGTTV